MNIDVDPTPVNVESPIVNVSAPEVKVSPEIKVEVPPIEIPPAEVNVEVIHEQGPKKATIKHPDQTISQVELKD